MSKSKVLEMGALLAGALAGWAAMRFFHTAPNRDLFLAAVDGAWFGGGLLAAFRGKLSLRGRTGPGRQWQGTAARVLGIVIAVLAASFYFLAWR